MQKKSFIKDLYRSIFKSKARFFSILAIIAIGVSFFAGINVTQPDMILSADAYYKENNLSDFKTISPLGFRGKDLREFKNINGVGQIQEGYEKDLYVISPEGDSSTVKIYSYDEKDYRGGKGLNMPIVEEGRLPEKPGEMVVERNGNLPSSIKIGSKLSIGMPKEEKREDFLKREEYKVVGIVKSPLYISFERDQTNIGAGSIDYFAYIHQADFDMERWSTVFVGTEKSDDLVAYSTDYKRHSKEIEEKIDALGIERIKEEIDGLREELEEGKKDLEEEKNKAEKELEDAKQELDNAQREIEKGEKELAKNERIYKKELAKKRKELEAGKEKLAAGRERYFENYAQWLEGYNEYQDGKAELDQSKVQLDRAKNQIDAAQRDLEQGKAELDEAKTQIESLETAVVELNKIRDTLPEERPTLTQEEFNNLIQSIRPFSQELANYIEENFSPEQPDLLPQLNAALTTTINELEKALTDAKKDYQAGLKEYEEGKKVLPKKRAEYEKGLREYNKGLATLNASKTEIDKGKAQLDGAKAQLDKREKEMIEGEAALLQGERDLERSLKEGRAELQKARRNLEKGRKEYQEEKIKAEKEIEEAEEEIQDAEREILEIPDEWIVSSRSDYPGHSTYGDDAQRIGAVAKVFPLFFFLIAALVCLTTMTRMIEEERTQIGTLKALGYPTLIISSKYIIYALFATLTGAIMGLLVGFKLFPTAIMSAYGTMYNIPNRLTPFHWNYAWISLGMALVTTMSASLLASMNELRATPAILMQPKAPKPGKRILLERISPLWSRLSFIQKVTARNLFRYKRRFLMTVIGIAGCTALLLTGLGIRDSINVISDKQFEEIFVYDGQVFLDTEIEEEKRQLKDILGEEAQVKNYMEALNESITVLSSNNGKSQEATMMVPKEGENLKDFIDLHERKSGEDISLTSNGVVISEKLANLLEIKVGDNFKYRDTDNITYEVRVEDITENYLSHYIYMTPDYYESVVKKEAESNTGVFNIKDQEEVDESNFQEKLIEKEGVLGAIFTEEITDELDDTLTSLNFVVLILIISAGTLAFVVLYNLTNINITERIREIATIKVLGFRDKEVSSYVYRENIILTIIGALVGLLLGFILHRYVMVTMEIDTMMFGKKIHLLSYMISFVLTMVFSFFVNFVMYFKLRKVDMVESLKSIE